MGFFWVMIQAQEKKQHEDKHQLPSTSVPCRGQQSWGQKRRGGGEYIPWQTGKVCLVCEGTSASSFWRQSKAPQYTRYINGRKENKGLSDYLNFWPLDHCTSFEAFQAFLWLIMNVWRYRQYAEHSGLTQSYSSRKCNKSNKNFAQLSRNKENSVWKNV